jgi:muramidase (phage lysozyme)
MIKALVVMSFVGAAVFYSSRARASNDRPIQIVNDFLDDEIAYDDSPYNDFFSPDAPTDLPYNQQNFYETEMNNQHPLMRLITQYESGGAYNILYGGARFTDFSTHPWSGWNANSGPKSSLILAGKKPAIITKGIYKGQRSTAAGRHQFMLDSWNDYARKLGLTDFSPESQDAAAMQYIKDIGALRMYQAGNFEGAIRAMARVWTSLPSSTTGEAQLSMDRAVNELRNYG